MWAPIRPRGVAIAAKKDQAVASTNTSAQATGCHSGPALTNNTTVNVGTGGSFQVPSLRGVSLRGPWMHDGCAKTLTDRYVQFDTQVEACIRCGLSGSIYTQPTDVEGEINGLMTYDRRVVKVDAARVESWIKKGAMPSETVAQILARAKKQAPAAPAKA